MRHVHSGGPDVRHATSPARRRLGRPGRRGRRWMWGTAAVVLGALAWGGWLVVDAAHARHQLSQVSDLVTTLEDQVLKGDGAGATITLAQIQAHADRARASTHGLQWEAAAALPLVGANVDALQVVTEVVDDLATTALPALMDATRVTAAGVLVPVEGRVDTGALSSAASTVTAAQEAVAAAVARLDAVPTGGLWAPVADPLGLVRAEVAEVSRTTSTASLAAQVLPAMLGMSGPRDYLLLVCDDAELRAAGGVPRAIVVLHSDGGVVTVTGTRSVASLGVSDAPVVSPTADEAELFGPGLATNVREATRTPDFPRAAEVVAAAWAQQVGGDVDGVLSVDPTALALVLDDVGPVAVAPGPLADLVGGQLTAETLPAAILAARQAFADDAALDDAFGSVAGAVLTALLAGQGEPAAAVDALAEAARQGRLMVWSAHDDEQALLSGTVLAGELAGADATAPVIGVYLDDVTQASTPDQLQADVTADAGQCLSDGSRSVTVTVTLTSVPATAAVDPNARTSTEVLIYAPSGGDVTGLQVAGVDVDEATGPRDDLAVAAQTVDVAPGASVTVSAQVTTGAARAGQVGVRRTPTAAGSTTVDVTTACG